MSAEDQEMMARISQLAGQINRHKNQQAGMPSLPPPRPVSHSMSTTRKHRKEAEVDGFCTGGGYHPGFYRGAPYPPRFRGGSIRTHRNRTLVLHGANQLNKTADPDSETASDSSSSPWILRNDRHRQLINPAVYDKDVKARTRAIEQTRIQKRAARDLQERARLVGHFKRVANPNGTTNLQGPYEVVIEGIRFLVTKNGSKLIKVPGDGNSAKATPKTAVVAGVRFYRSKNGNLFRHGIVKAQRRSGPVKKVDEPCREFSTTGTSHLTPRPSDREAQRRRLRHGSCRYGPQCRYVHDPRRVAVCKDFLQKGQCINGEACDLSHDLTAERIPACLHFAKDHCTNPNCRYAHVKVAPGAPVCRSFGIYGYCPKGTECTERHVFECPDFSNTGVCKTKGCKLLHRERASVLRRNGAGREQNSDEAEEMEDVSSDDDGDSIDSDDVDSDAVEEFIGEEDGEDFAQQKDFIEF